MTDSGYREPPTDVRSLSPAALLARLRSGERVSLLDVRDRDEFEQWRIDGPAVEAVQLPYVKFVQAEITGGVADLAGETGLDEPVVAVCGEGEASAYAAGLLTEAGVEALNLDGGMEAWARLYVGRAVERADGVEVVQYERPSSGCLGSLVVAGDEAAVVDPLRAFADRYAADAAERGADLAWAVDTHVHADHLSGVRRVAAATDATPAVPAGALDRGLDPDAFDGELRTVADGEELPVGDATLAAVHAPGHTSELTAFRAGNVLFSADTLFLDGVGRPDLEAGDDGAPDLAGRLYRTLHDRLLELPGETVVAPGHAAPATDPAGDGTFTARLGDLADSLALLGLDEAAFVDRVTGDVPPRPANYEAIIEANLGRSTVEDDEAFELELGPNNCAVSSAAD